MAYSNESVSEIYLSYLLLVVFLSIKLFAVYGIIKQIKAVVHLLFNTPNFGDKSRETIGCDLSQKVPLHFLRQIIVSPMVSHHCLLDGVYECDHTDK